MEKRTILSLIDKENNILVLNENGEYVYRPDALDVNLVPKIVLAEKNNFSGQKIHSVRRESDGEVFTLGEKFYYYGNRDITSIDVDVSFEGEIRIGFGESALSIESIDKNLMNKFFMSEDGVEIRSGDECFFINSEFEINPIICDGFTSNSRKNIFKSFYKAAERKKWIRKSYSLEQIKEAIDNDDLFDIVVNKLLNNN